MSNALGSRKPSLGDHIGNGQPSPGAQNAERLFKHPHFGGCQVDDAVGNDLVDGAVIHGQGLNLAQAELVQKERLAVLGQLTATVSHEIRNPLGTIANSLYLLKESLQGAEHANLAKPLLLAERNVERCDTIISDLLDFSRQRRIEKTPILIDDWMTDFLEEMDTLKDVQMEKDLSTNSVVPVDPERLRRALVNVITNALQALDEVEKPDKKLLVRTRLVDETCEIIVQDNGPGMGQDVLKRIYEPMFSTKNFGVGLGVPIIKNIVEGHGGGVEYVSEAGEGTTVIMRLPLTEMTSGKEA